MRDLTEKQRKAAVDGYAVFFDAFIRNDPQRFIDFSNFTSKHYENPWLLEDPAVIEYVGDAPAAMVWFMGMPLLHQGKEFLCAHGADYGSTAKGHGLPALRALVRGRECLAKQGIPFRFGAPSDHAFSVASKLGYELVGEFHEYGLTFPQESKSDNSPDHRERQLRERAGLSGEGAGQVTVTTSLTCPFTEDDYTRMNASDKLVKVLRSSRYYSWRIGTLHGRTFAYCRADKNGDLAGYLLLEVRDGHARIVDWDVLGKPGQQADALAALLAAASQYAPSLIVTHINTVRGEEKLFERFSFRRMGDVSGKPYVNRLCIMPSSGDINTVDATFCDFSRWKLREIDRDYFMNCNPV